ncbi:hypothetical protein J6590_007489 [Homalodisca vitripennis]|nr:hypothetical protein J6590_007489 [Homalodisca vitripennis]
MLTTKRLLFPAKQGANLMRSYFSEPSKNPQPRKTTLLMHCTGSSVATRFFRVANCEWRIVEEEREISCWISPGTAFNVLLFHHNQCKTRYLLTPTFVINSARRDLVEFDVSDFCCTVRHIYYTRLGPAIFRRGLFNKAKFALQLICDLCQGKTEIMTFSVPWCNSESVQTLLPILCVWDITNPSHQLLQTLMVFVNKPAFTSLAPLLRRSSAVTGSKLLLYTLVIWPSSLRPVWYKQLTATPRKQLKSFQQRAVRFRAGFEYGLNGI